MGRIPSSLPTYISVSAILSEDLASPLPCVEETLGSDTAIRSTSSLTYVLIKNFGALSKSLKINCRKKVKLIMEIRTAAANVAYGKWQVNDVDAYEHSTNSESYVTFTDVYITTNETETYKIYLRSSVSGYISHMRDKYVKSYLEVLRVVVSI